MGKNKYLFFFIIIIITAHLCTFVLVCQPGKLPPKIAVDAPLAVTVSIQVHTASIGFQHRNKYPAEQKAFLVPEFLLT